MVGSIYIYIYIIYNIYIMRCSAESLQLLSTRRRQKWTLSAEQKRQRRAARAGNGA